MYSKMLRQFSKGSLISISSESSKIHLLIKVLYRPICFKLSKQQFLFYALNVSLSYQQQCYFITSQYSGLQTSNISALSICQYICVRGHSYIESSHSLCQNDAKFQTHPTSTLHIKMANLHKIDVYNFRYKISVGNLMKLFFLWQKCINK